MNTFFGNRQLSALDNLDREVGFVAGSLDVLDLLDDVVALKDLAEDDVLAVQPAAEGVCQPNRNQASEGAGQVRGLPSNDGGDEELRAVGVLASVGHGQLTLLGVLELEILIGELGAVDYS